MHLFGHTDHIVLIACDCLSQSFSLCSPLRRRKIICADLNLGKDGVKNARDLREREGG